MSDTEPSAGRRRGREARRVVRAAPLAEDKRPVRGGEQSGRYRPLTDADVARIHEAVLTILETTGLGLAIPSCVEAVEAAGGKLDSRGRLLFPRALIEDTVANAAREFPICGQDPKHDMEPWGLKTYFGTAGAAVHIADPETNEYRESYLQDLYDCARIVDCMDNIHFFQRNLVARDMEDPLDLDINTLYAAVSGTSKHVGTSWTVPEHLEASLPILHAIAGSEAKFRERPFVSMSNCFVVPPMKFAEDACACLETAVRAGIPVLLLAAGQAGATSPASLAGAVVQEVAEVLAGLVYVNAIVPGAHAIYGTWPFVSDLRSGAMSGGSGEQALLMAACGQMAHFYGLTGGVTAGMADAKMPDFQAGAEKGYNHALVANAPGVNMVYESAGMHASLLGTCLESLVLDNDAIGAVLRTVRGIEVNDETLAIDVINDVCINGPGHFLGSDQTLSLMQSEYVYPTVFDRSSPKEWVELGRPNVVKKATEKVREIKSTHFPRHISDELDARIRGLADVKLDRAAMTAEA
ncbi:MAG: trimethylamine methyltransferase family protein [Rhodospirillales bacterium]